MDPNRLEPALREAVCQQCHLEGEARVLRLGRGLNDFRPGMPLDDFWAVFVHAAPAGEPAKAVGHVEQMYESRCYRQSPADRKMGCTSCHNPHEAVAPENRVAYFRGRCLQCHAPPATACRVPEATRRATRADDSCIACHMPRAATADIVHTAATDHRILRRPGAEPTDRPARPPSPWPIADFFRPEHDPADVGRGRDFGVGVYAYVAQRRPLTQALGEYAIGLLDRAVAACPGDLEAWEAKGGILQTMGRLGPAAAAYEAALPGPPAGRRPWPRWGRSTGTRADGRGGRRLAAGGGRQPVGRPVPQEPGHPPGRPGGVGRAPPAPAAVAGVGPGQRRGPVRLGRLPAAGRPAGRGRDRVREGPALKPPDLPGWTPGSPSGCVRPGPGRCREPSGAMSSPRPAPAASGPVRFGWRTYRGGPPWPLYSRPERPGSPGRRGPIRGPLEPPQGLRGLAVTQADQTRLPPRGRIPGALDDSFKQGVQPGQVGLDLLEPLEVLPGLVGLPGRRSRQSPRW